MGPEQRYWKRYSEIEVRWGKWVMGVRIGTDQNGVRTGSDITPCQNLITGVSISGVASDLVMDSGEARERKSRRRHW